MLYGWTEEYSKVNKTILFMYVKATKNYGKNMLFLVSHQIVDQNALTLRANYADSYCNESDCKTFTWIQESVFNDSYLST